MMMDRNGVSAPDAVVPIWNDSAIWTAVGLELRPKRKTVV